MSNQVACRTTHPQILAGTCPECRTPVGDQPSATAPHAVTPEGQRWDIAHMKADLDHEDPKVRLMTIRILRRHPPDVTEALDVLRIALENSVERIRQDAMMILARLGTGMAADAGEEYEAESRRRPDDLAVRILLLGHYSRSRFVSEAARMARQAHVLWVIEHAPASSIAGTPFASLDGYADGAAYERAKQLWMAQVEAHPEDTAILGNAASFFTLHDKTRCGELLRRARSLEPDNPEWSQRLGHLYSLEMIGKDPATRRDWAAMTQAEYERGQGLYRDDRRRLGQLPRLAEAAFEAGDHAKAHAYASELLSRADDGYRGEAIFHGNQVLGRLALADGDVERAKAHLIASAETTGSPVLRSFGPSMVLARELLVRGEREAVLRYLERCSSFWQYGADRLSRWAAAIERGETPDFQPRA